MIPNVNEVNVLENSANRRNNNGFICGVVEGFYGQPWTMDQRRKLFTRMASLGMNTYIYAPKDDIKHRMHWRDLYTVDEAEPLTTLIEAATEHGVTFVYALSPGLDITYSSSKDIACLKHKLEQVSSFGCEAYALLFDDIDIELCDADKTLYQSFAAAQVSVTNEVYQHLHQPSRFFFCPTEYCASRAVPSVTQSEYLNTIGTKLLPDVEVMWTGPKVISKRITIHSIEEVSRVLRRPPLIWDNLHANDYDPKRLFLGPYEGRSPRLVPYIRGVLTNPNCEFESDFVALHTLAQWSKANDDGCRRKKDPVLNGSPVSADIRLETEGSGSSSGTDDDDLAESADNAPNEYTPRQALRTAISAWLPEFFVTTPPVGSLHRKSTIGIIPTPVIPAYVPPIIGGNKAVDQMAILEVADGYVQPIPAVTGTSSLSLDKLSDSDASSSASSLTNDMEPMDCAISPSSTPASVGSINTSVINQTGANDVNDDVDGDDVIVNSEDVISSDTLTPSEKMQVDTDAVGTSVTVDDIATIIDMFYLPFEHGPRAARLLTDFFWIKLHAADSIDDTPAADTCDQLLVGCCDDCEPTSPADTPDERVLSEDWREQVRTYMIRLRWICDTIDRVLSIPNRALAYELFPYLWDIKAVVYLLECFVQWLGANKFYRDQLLCRDQEPWLFRGGLLGEIQRMLPFENAPDLLFYSYPSNPQSNMFRIRPYKQTDKDSVYKVCNLTCDDGSDGSHLCPDQSDLMPDRLIGAFLTYSSENCFVIVDQQGCVCGYVLSTPDVSAFSDRIATSWIPYITQKYPLQETNTTEKTLAREIISNFHSECKPVLPQSDRHQSLIRINVTQQAKDSVLGDPTIIKRALACAVITLKVNGSKGIYTTVNPKHTNTTEMYRTLGFVDMLPVDATKVEDLCVMGRPI